MEAQHRRGQTIGRFRRWTGLFAGLALLCATLGAGAQQPLPAKIKIGVLISLSGAASVGVALSSVPAIKLAIKENSFVASIFEQCF